MYFRTSPCSRPAFPCKFEIKVFIFAIAISAKVVEIFVSFLKFSPNKALVRIVHSSFLLIHNRTALTLGNLANGVFLMIKNKGFNTRQKKEIKESLDFLGLWMMIGTFGATVIGIILFYIDYHFIAANSNPLFSLAAKIIAVPTSALRELFGLPISGMEDQSLFPFVIYGALFAAFIAIFMVVIPTMEKLKKLK